MIKRVLIAIVLILMCSINVFASSIYIDQDTGTRFTLPDNWSEIPLSKERQYIDAKFINDDETAIIIYGSYDLTTEVSSKDEVEILRDYLDMSFITIDDAKEILGEEGFSNIEKVTYNGVDYFKAEMKTTQTIAEYETTIEQIQFIHYNNGWAYTFMIEKAGYYVCYDDFKSIIESVKYPNTDGLVYDEDNLSSNARTALSYYELFQSGPAVYIPVILVMLIITVVAYSVFPLIFAFARKKVVSNTKYKIFCYGINLLVMFLFVVVNGKSSGGPYFLWTCVFSIVGTNILKRRCVLEGYQRVSISRDETETKTSGTINNELDESRIDEVVEDIRVNVCKKCGANISSNSLFCHKCGTKITMED